MNNMVLLMKSDETSFFETLGRQIALLRKQQGYTQTQLADMIDVKQYVIASYETGRRRPSAALIPELAKALGVSLDELLGLPAQKGGRRGPKSELEKRISAVRNLPKKDQELASQLLDRLLASS